MKYCKIIILHARWFSLNVRTQNRVVKEAPLNVLTINGKNYASDHFTNVTPKILSYIGRNLHNQEYHPICLLKQRVIKFFNSKFTGRSGNPIFSMYDNIGPVVTIQENFDSLLVPEDHVSRSKSDCYYVNKSFLLRSHCTAHQSELISMGLDNFIVFGDVYRRDEIDRTHYPVFHQADGVYTLNNDQINNFSNSNIQIFESSNRNEDTSEKQGQHTIEVTKYMETHLKSTLVSLAQHIWKDVEYQWVSSVFPFTHPSWELQMKINNEWTEVLGCGIMKHDIISRAGAGDRIGWAFGLGLDRLVMMLYSIPDIRVLWSQDSGFLSQFQGANEDTPITFKPVSAQPQCYNDISFWLQSDKLFNKSDFFDLVRTVGGDYVEQVIFRDEFVHPKTGLISHCYRIVYRHMERPLTKEEVNIIHQNIMDAATNSLYVTIRK